MCYCQPNILRELNHLKNESPMTPQERIDAALDAVLLASGSALKNYTLPNNLERMREAMRKIMSDSYIAGSNAAHRILMGRD